MVRIASDNPPGFKDRETVRCVNRDERQPDKLPTALLVFNPHPYRVLFDPEYKPLLTNYERELMVSELGVDYLLEYPFSAEFAAMSCEQFCHKLVNELMARVIVVGEGYRFGHNRAGTVGTLQQMTKRVGAQVHVVSPHMVGHCCMSNNVAGVSSQKCHISDGNINKTSTSTIRTLLAANQLPEANNLLGYPFFVMGEAVLSEQHECDNSVTKIELYPPEDKFLPADGIYTTCTIIDGSTYNSVTNIGQRPKLDDKGVMRFIETYLHDYDGRELCGKLVCVEFLQLYGKMGLHKSGSCNVKQKH